jgi:hypothetical protein
MNEPIRMTVLHDPRLTDPLAGQVEMTSWNHVTPVPKDIQTSKYDSLLRLLDTEFGYVWVSAGHAACSRKGRPKKANS